MQTIGIYLAIISGWLMAAVIAVLILPFLIGSGVFYLKTIGDKERNQKQNYFEAGGHAHKAISSIKTVKQLVGE